MADILNLTRISYVVVLGAAITNLATGVIDPTIAPYLEILGSNSESIGKILSVRWLVVAIASIPFALLSSRIGEIRVLQMSALFAMISGVIIVQVAGADGIYYFYLVIGMASAASSGSAAAVLAENTGTKRVAAFALYSITWQIPPAIGSGISAFWFRNSEGYTVDDLSSIFVVVFIVLVIGGAFYIILLQANTMHSTHNNLEQRGIRKEMSILFAPIILLPLLSLMLVNFLSGAGAGATLPFLSPYLKGLGASPTELSLLVLALNLSMGIATQTVAPLSRLFGEVRIYIITTVLSTVCLISLVLTQDLMIAAIFYILRGTFANMNAPIGQATVLSYIDNRVRATGSAFATNIRWIGWTMFSPISGRIIDEFGYQISFYFTALLYLIATAVFAWVVTTQEDLETRLEKGE